MSVAPALSRTMHEFMAWTFPDLALPLASTVEVVPKAVKNRNTLKNELHFLVIHANLCRESKTMRTVLRTCFMRFNIAEGRCAMVRRVHAFRPCGLNLTACL